ncbi:MAG: DNA replication and repair protein RecF [Saprospiraceae bacterium]
MTTLEVHSLSMTNFKSYEAETYSFGSGFQVIVGRNGMGKTNVLDALHYLGLCRSYFPLRDSELLRHGSEFFRLEASIRQDGRPVTYTAKVVPGSRKDFEKDKNTYSTLAEHIGQMPVVLIAPNDTEIISGFSEARRKFMDQTLCQVDQTYLAHLSSYNRLLLQRNAYLKSLLQGKRYDPAVLEAIDQQLSPSAEYIASARRTFVKELLELVRVNYQAISQAAEQPSGIYQGALDESNWSELMQQNHSTDLRMGRTMKGLHRDELVLTLDQHPARRFSSQGQLKSLVFALKIAQFQYTSSVMGRIPLLLLDDIFDKLDQYRVSALLTFLVDQQVGQVFITDTDEDRVPEALLKMKQAFRTFHVHESQITEVTTG